jgi:hypothetical protein
MNKKNNICNIFNIIKKIVMAQQLKQHPYRANIRQMRLPQRRRRKEPRYMTRKRCFQVQRFPLFSTAETTCAWEAAVAAALSADIVP